jgi:hypothetical protein
MYNFAACSIQSSFELNASPLPYGLSSVAYYGTSALAKDKNNLFGLKATDDSPYGNGEAFNSKFMYNFAACSIQSSFELNASPLPYGLSSVAFKPNNQTLH